jgi:hypothetical protein
MPRKRHSAEEIVTKLRQAGGQGVEVPPDPLGHAPLSMSDEGPAGPTCPTARRP